MNRVHIIKVRTVVMLRDINDFKVREATIALKTDRKWVTQQQQPMRTPTSSTRRLLATSLNDDFVLRTSPSQDATVSHMQIQELLQSEVRKEEKEKVVPKYSRNETAGAMDTFRSVLSSRKLTQNGGRHDQISSAFYTYDVQATLTNLRTWGLQEDLACTLCEQLGKTLNMFYHSTFP